ncbi:PRC-barrel domain containing protein [Aerophototrophica crusticola]|uniref:PRC-barrel domain containing protein n=1 Tax=Aerophototrophica crusticola TaxID=1709002 RepID=A0A858RA14_9PROT|nr:PRC-barrel domain containing protein [Rhodospirillaceae bacterium B3]
MRTTLLAAAAALALSGAAFAQSGGSATGTGAGTSTTGSGSMATTGPGTSAGNTAGTGGVAQGPNWVSLNKLIDRDVVDAQGKELGEVEDVVMSRDGSRIQAIIDIEDDEKDVAVDANRLQAKQGSDDLVLQGMDRQQLTALPEFTYDTSQVGLSNEPSTRK